MNIFVNVVGQKMYASSCVDGLVEGSQNFVKFKFNLDEDWQGLMPFAQFSQGSRSYNLYLDNENCVFLPREIVEGYCTVMLYGSDDGVIGTTNCLTLKIGKNFLISDVESTQISESLYDQLVTKVNELVTNTGAPVSKIQIHIGGTEPNDVPTLWFDTAIV